VAQGVGPEFKPQHHKKEKRKRGQWEGGEDRKEKRWCAVQGIQHLPSTCAALGAVLPSPTPALETPNIKDAPPENSDSKRPIPRDYTVLHHTKSLK
jgi:hypothetical protein